MRGLESSNHYISMKASMRWDISWLTLRLICVVVEDEVAYQESIGDVEPSVSVSDLSINWGDISVDPYMNIRGLSSSWMSWGGSACHSTSWGDF
jgi:hypothetical protein